MARVACPNHQVLQRLLGGQLSRPEVEQLANHVEACERCGQTLDGLKIDDTMGHSCGDRPTMPANRWTLSSTS